MLRGRAGKGGALQYAAVLQVVCLQKPPFLVITSLEAYTHFSLSFSLLARILLSLRAACLRLAKAIRPDGPKSEGQREKRKRQSFKLFCSGYDTIFSCCLALMQGPGRRKLTATFCTLSFSKQQEYGGPEGRQPSKSERGEWPSGRASHSARGLAAERSRGSPIGGLSSQCCVVLLDKKVISHWPGSLPRLGLSLASPLELA